jgi:ATP-binding cassette subfamily B protein
VALAATPVFWLVARRFSDPIRQLARERRSRLADLYGHAEEVIGAAAQVQASRAETHEHRRFDLHSRSVGRLGVDSTRVTARLSPIVDGVELAAALLVISLGAWSVTEGRITVGGLIAFLTYLTQMYSPVRALTSFVADIQRAAAGAERISGILDEEPLVMSPSHASHRTIGSGRLVVEGVTVGYPGRERSALCDVDMVFEPGTTTAIVGPSGSGKSTLVSLLVRFMDPDLGRVTLDGHDLRDLPLSLVRETVGLLPQESYLFRGTIAENVAYGTEAVDDVVSAYLDAVGASFVSSLPDGIQSRVDGRGHGLSGGERRRIAIARLLTQRPRVLVLDEFTNGLDREAVSEVLEWLDGHVETVILVTHDPEVAAAADRVIAIEAGRARSVGEPVVANGVVPEWSLAVPIAPGRVGL